jgi:hypothetical protein
VLEGRPLPAEIAARIQAGIRPLSSSRMRRPARYPFTRPVVPVRDRGHQMQMPSVKRSRRRFEGGPCRLDLHARRRRVAASRGRLGSRSMRHREQRRTAGVGSERAAVRPAAAGLRRRPRERDELHPSEGRSAGPMGAGAASASVGRRHSGDNSLRMAAVGACQFRCFILPGVYGRKCACKIRPVAPGRRCVIVSTPSMVMV